MPFYSPTTSLLHNLPFSFDHDKNMILLYLIRAVHQLQNRLVAFFVPVFIFQLGWTEAVVLVENLSAIQNGVLLVSGYYLLYRSISFVLNIPLAKAFANIGMSRTLALSQPLNILYFLTFILAESYPLVIVAAALLHTLKDHSFWHSNHVVLAAGSDEGKIGEDIGVLQFGMELISVLAPYTGGLLTVFIGFYAVFFAGAVLSLIGMGVALQFEDIPEQHPPTGEGFWEWAMEQENRTKILGFFGDYWKSAAVVVWSLYVFVLLGSVDALGLLFTISLFISLALSVVAGIYVDHQSDDRPFYVTTGLMSLNWLARTQVFNPVAVAITDTIDNMLSKVHYVFFQSHYLKGPREKGFLQHFVYIEQVFCLSALLFWSVLGLLFAFFEGWTVFLVAGAVGAALTVLISR